jgi:uncharacterized protein (DUF342 family)
MTTKPVSESRIPNPESSRSFTKGAVVAIDLSGTKGAPSYDIVIGDSILAEAGTLIALRLGRRRTYSFTSHNYSSRRKQQGF